MQIQSPSSNIIGNDYKRNLHADRRLPLRGIYTVQIDLFIYLLFMQLGTRRQWPVLKGNRYHQKQQNRYAKSHFVVLRALAIRTTGACTWHATADYRRMICVRAAGTKDCRFGGLGRQYIGEGLGSFD